MSSSSHLQRAANAGELVRRRSEMRVTDAEREDVANRLRGAYGLGALTYEELEERLARTFASRTRGDLSRLTRDLPRDPAKRDAHARAGFRWHVATYTAVNGSLVGMWAVTGGPFWPAGSLAPWGAAVALHAYSCRRALFRRPRRG